LDAANSYISCGIINNTGGGGGGGAAAAASAAASGESGRWGSHGAEEAGEFREISFVGASEYTPLTGKGGNAVGERPGCCKRCCTIL